jgi:hypothetical protein
MHAPGRLIRRHLARAFGPVMALTVAACVLVTVGGAGVSETIPLSGSGAATLSSSSSAIVSSGHGGPFPISGGIAGLYPGASLPLVLTIANPEPFAISVTSVTTTVVSPSAQCPGTLLTVTPFSGTQSVSAHGTSDIIVTVSLAHAAPDACQGATFPFLYNGLATKA